MQTTLGTTSHETLKGSILNSHDSCFQKETSAVLAKNLNWCHYLIEIKNPSLARLSNLPFFFELEWLGFNVVFSISCHLIGIRIPSLAGVLSPFY